MNTPNINLTQLTEQFGTDEKCRKALEQLRWKDGAKCPRCDSSATAIANRFQYDCDKCHYQFSVTAGTIFHDSHLSLWKWFMTTALLCEAKKGMSACQIQRTVGMSYKTAWYLCHRIRAAMIEIDKPKLNGQIEMDETYIGGKARGGKAQGITGRGSDKEIVVGIRQRNGELRLFHSKDVRAKTLAKYIRENVSQDVEVIITDDLPAYPRAIGDLPHETVNHTTKEYARYENGACISTNTVESAFSLLKRGIVGSWHKISAKHLAAYLDEMTFRFNRRKRSDLFIDTLRHMVTADPLTFERLTA